MARGEGRARKAGAARPSVADHRDDAATGAARTSQDAIGEPAGQLDTLTRVGRRACAAPQSLASTARAVAFVARGHEHAELRAILGGRSRNVHPLVSTSRRERCVRDRGTRPCRTCIALAVVLDVRNRPDSHERPRSGLNFTTRSLAVFASRSRAARTRQTITQDALPPAAVSVAIGGTSPWVALEVSIATSLLFDQPCPGALRSSRNGNEVSRRRQCFRLASAAFRPNVVAPAIPPATG